MQTEPSVESFHAHVYFDASTRDRAVALCETAASKFELEMGRVHERPIGPHPRWSCQLAFPTHVFGTLVPWLALHRDGLVILIHPNTGDDLRDHTEHAIWMETALALNLDVLR